MIPQDFIQTLLDRVDIVDVVERYVPLKKAGANLKACCPFHNEKSPSFNVSQTKQFYHCFGCGAHGTAISFLMEYAGMGFIEAVKDLADGVGMQVPAQEMRRDAPLVDGAPLQEETGNLPQLYDTLYQAMQFYRDELKTAPHAIAYLKQRGLSGEIAARFGIGYAPAGWQSLEKVFPDYPSKNLIDAGMVIKNEEGRHYDRFRDRVMFPIVNPKGNIIGFGGRVLDKGEPKYLNSPETPVFDKGRELYGLYQARKAIREKGRVMVVEGYMDVVALAQHGVEYAVATLGTATTPTHIQKLLRATQNVVFCFDGDKAGRTAAWRALEVALPYLTDGANVSFLFLPQEHDPDSYVREHGREDFEKLLLDAPSLSTYMLRELTSQVDLKNEEGRARLLQNAKPLISQITAPTLSLLLRNRLTELTGVSRVEIDSLLQLAPVRMERQAAGPARAPRNAPSLEGKMIGMVLHHPPFAVEFGTETNLGVTPDAKALMALVKIIKEKNLQKSGHLEQYFQDSPFQKIFQDRAAEGMEQEENFSEADLLAEFRGALGQLHEMNRKREIDELLKKSQREPWSEAEKARYRELEAAKRVESSN
ncbi:MAG: primase [Pseudomonadota bacterium]|jgi:DNA primase